MGIQIHGRVAMNSREQYEFYCKTGLLKPDDDIVVIKNLVNLLIKALYIPVKNIVEQVDPLRIKKFKIEDEPINWGSLSCTEVTKFTDGTYRVVIEEAAPDDCITFCNYIERYMRSYGWPCEVKTEW